MILKDLIQSNHVFLTISEIFNEFVQDFQLTVLILCNILVVLTKAVQVCIQKLFGLNFFIIFSGPL